MRQKSWENLVWSLGKEAWEQLKEMNFKAHCPVRSCRVVFWELPCLHPSNCRCSIPSGRSHQRPLLAVFPGFASNLPGLLSPGWSYVPMLDFYVLSSSCLPSLSVKSLSLLRSPQSVFVFLFIHLNIAIFSGLSQPYWSSTGINSSQRTQNNHVRISVTCTEPEAKQELVFHLERDTIKTRCSGLHFHFECVLSYVLG